MTLEEAVKNLVEADRAFNRKDILAVATVDVLFITPAGMIGALTPEMHATWLAMHADRFDEYDRRLKAYLDAKSEVLRLGAEL